PVGLTTAPGFEKVTLSWSLTPGATGYQVFRSSTVGGQFVLVNAAVVAQPSSGPVTFNDTGISPDDCAPAAAPCANPHLADNTTYFYAVQALNATGPSATSARAKGFTFPGAPISPSATGQASGAPPAVTISW